MGAGVSPGVLIRWKKKAYEIAERYSLAVGATIVPRTIRASNGEVAIVYDIQKNGNTETVLSLKERFGLVA